LGVPLQRADIATVGWNSLRAITLHSDGAKLKAYCELDKLQDEMDKAEEANDKARIDALVAKADGSEDTLGPQFMKISDGLRALSPTRPNAENSLIPSGEVQIETVPLGGSRLPHRPMMAYSAIAEFAAARGEDRDA
jgi:hypothetical protein